MDDLFILVADIFVDVVAALISTGLSSVIVIVYTSVAVFPS